MNKGAGGGRLRRIFGRRAFLAGGAGMLIAWPWPARAQRSGSTFRIGVLVSGSPPQPIVDLLRGALRELGYEEGRRIAFEVRYGDGRTDRVAAAAAELVKLDVDLIVAHYTPACVAAKKATSTIPIVMAPAGAPVLSGLVASLARPGGNVTGVSAMGAELGGKRLELLSAAIPQLARVAVLASSADPFTKPFVADLQSAADRANLKLQTVMVEGPAEFPAAFATMAAAGAQAVVVQALFDPHRAVTLELAAKHRLPVLSSDRDTLLGGGLLSYWVDEEEVYKRAASYVDRILKGAKPADLPVEQPTKFSLAINLKTAAALGLTLPPLLIGRADEVIE